MRGPTAAAQKERGLHAVSAGGVSGRGEPAVTPAVQRREGRVPAAPARPGPIGHSGLSGARGVRVNEAVRVPKKPFISPGWTAARAGASRAVAGRDRFGALVRWHRGFHLLILLTLLGAAGAAAAPAPAGQVAKPSPADDWAAAFQRRLDWWSLRPLRDTPPPPVSDAAWGREPVDRFVLAALTSAKLSPAPSAGPEVLLRRLAIVLTGLPPTPRQRAELLQHWQTNGAAAYERLVEELLASPHFGERFARHWMDAVRYTDTYGYEWDNPAKGSWEYRDYLIRAFNGDVSFAQFLTEQLAGDLLPAPRLNRELGINESLIGPMFYHLGEHRHGSSLGFFNGVHQEMVNNKIDAFSKVFLGLTVACARCHDHKLEAVSQRDYYALAALFMTPRWTARVVDAPDKNDAVIGRLKELRAAIRRELAAQWLATVNQEKAWPLDAPGALATLLATTNAAAATKATPAPKPDELEHPLTQLLSATDDVVAQRWHELATGWQTNRTARLKANAAFTWLADFQEPKLPAGWVIEGDGMKHGYVTDGTPLIALEGEAVVARLLPRGYHTHALSAKLPGALRMPPQLSVPGRIASLQLAGGEFSGYLPVPGNAFQNEPLGFLSSPTPTWTAFADERLNNGVPHVTVEFATSSLNPNFPPRTGLAKGLANSDLGYDKRSWLSITGIVGHDQAGAPQDTLEHFATLYDSPAPPSAADARRRLSDWLGGAVRRWAAGQSQGGDLRVLDWLLTKKLLPNRAAPGSPLAALLADYRRTEQSLEHPRTVNTMDEREVSRVSYPLNVRGDVDQPGEMIAPDFLQMFAGRNAVAQSRGSGRLELAESLVQPEHPLTARVYVNRVWQWVFGTGLVATPDDFGRLGELPSHPELLDFLAREFVRDGGSTKRLVRRLVLSQTFRQSGGVTAAARERDPANRLLHHYATRKMEAEVIRDALLAVSGRLDPQLYGRPIDPPRAAQDPAKRLYSGPLDGNGRRSLYLKMSIMEPPKFLVGFNLPDLKLPTGHRDVTGAPAQALLLLNDPLVSAMAGHWAKQLLQQSHATVEARVTAMFVQAYGRAPTDAELQRWTAALPDLAPPAPGDLLRNAAAWAQLAHALFNTKEFLYYR